MSEKDEKDLIIEELGEILEWTVIQACKQDEHGIFDSGALTAYADAFEMLVKIGRAEYAHKGYGRMQSIRILSNP